MHLVPIFPSSLKHAPLYDYGWTPIELARCCRKTSPENDWEHTPELNQVKRPSAKNEQIGRLRNSKH